MFAQHLIDDLLDGLVLEDPAIAGAGEQPQARHQPEAVHAQAAAAPLRHGKFGDDAVDRRAQAGAVVQPDGGRSAEDFVGLMEASVEASSRS